MSEKGKRQPKSDQAPQAPRGPFRPPSRSAAERDAAITILLEQICDRLDGIDEGIEDLKDMVGVDEFDETDEAAGTDEV